MEPYQFAPRGFCQCGCGQKTRLAPHSNHSGWVKGEPLRFLSGHHTRKTPYDYLEEDRGHQTPCWVWQRSRHPQGYGSAHDGRRTVRAHRLYYERAKGPVPGGLHLDHLCGVPACVNPDHLEAVTQAVNVRRGAGTKLTAEDVRGIRASTEPAELIAERFSVTSQYVTDLRRPGFKAWRDVPYEEAA